MQLNPIFFKDVVLKTEVVIWKFKWFCLCFKQVICAPFFHKCGKFVQNYFFV